MKKKLVIFAPVSGKTVDLSDVPDPVFSEKMVGDGLSIMPASFVLCAPVDGVVSSIHSSHHALTISTKEGVDILMHIGLETVMLKTKGFTVKTEVGQNVKINDPLIEFDADFIAKNAKSLLTEIIITNMDKIASITSAHDRNVVAGKDEIMTLTLAAEEADVKAAEIIDYADIFPTAESFGIEILNPVGLHARPIAVLANASKKYKSEVSLLHKNGRANAKSVVSVIGLDVKKGDAVTLKAVGPDAVEALEELIPLVASGLEEDLTKVPEPAVKKTEAPKKKAASMDGSFSGAPASKGMAIGVAVQKAETLIAVDEKAGSKEDEARKLDAAIDRAKEELEELAKTSAIFKAHLEIIEDPEIAVAAAGLIKKGKSAGYAWKEALKTQIDALKKLDNPMLAERAADLSDIQRRVLLVLSGKMHEKPALPDNAILIASDLTPSDTATLDRTKIVGLCTVFGGATSHVSILARSLGLPAVVGMDEGILDIPNGTEVFLDGTEGVLKKNPTDKEKQTAASSQKQELERQEAALKEKSKPAVTKDGAKIEVVGNIGGVKDAEQVVDFGGEGVGLLRSEFLFLDKDTAPTEQEQADIYSKIAQTLGKDRSLIVRTLDVGGDKPLAYLSQPKEENPFLGVRGIRLTLKEEQLFRTQIRSVLKAAGLTKMRLMFPMVSVADEIVKARQIVEEERKKLDAPKIDIGIMVEVPSIAIMADVAAPMVDFFSIGTNDLTQYVLAADRGNPEIAANASAFDPGVLRMIASAVEGAKKHNKWVGVCGGLASEESAVALLIGLGVTELSVTANAIPSIKAKVRSLELSACRKLAKECLALASAKEVQNKLETFK